MMVAGRAVLVPGTHKHLRERLHAEAGAQAALALCGFGGMPPRAAAALALLVLLGAVKAAQTAPRPDVDRATAAAAGTSTAWSVYSWATGGAVTARARRLQADNDSVALAASGDQSTANSSYVAFECCGGSAACGFRHCPALGAGLDGCVEPWNMPDKQCAGYRCPAMVFATDCEHDAEDIIVPPEKDSAAPRQAGVTAALLLLPPILVVAVLH